MVTKQIKEKIIALHCYTELVYQRINKKLQTSYTKYEIEELLIDIITDTPLACYEKIGKNYYISDAKNNIRVTVNSNTYRIITVDKV